MPRARGSPRCAPEKSGRHRTGGRPDPQRAGARDTLGDFFDEWGQPLGPGQVGPAKGHVVALYNDKVA